MFEQPLCILVQGEKKKKKKKNGTGPKLRTEIGAREDRGSGARRTAAVTLVRSFPSDVPPIVVSLPSGPVFGQGDITWLASDSLKVTK